VSFYRYFWYLKTVILGPWEVLEKSLNFVLSVCYEPWATSKWRKLFFQTTSNDIVHLSVSVCRYHTGPESCRVCLIHFLAWCCKRHSTRLFISFDSVCAYISNFYRMVSALLYFALFAFFWVVLSFCNFCSWFVFCLVFSSMYQREWYILNMYPYCADLPLRIYALTHSNGTSFDDLEWPLTQILRSLHILKSNYVKNGARYSHSYSWTLIRSHIQLTEWPSFSMTLNDPNPGFRSR